MYLRICLESMGLFARVSQVLECAFKADYQMMPFAANLLEHATDFDARADVAAQPRVRAKKQRVSFYRAYTKRVLDIFLVVMSLPVVLPIMVIGALLIMRDGHSPFYTQERVGKGGVPFKMLKLRTMVPNAKALLAAHLATDQNAKAEWDATQKLKKDPRITAIGRILRKSSVDELPQLLNVLKGDMSLVGPRPMMVEQEELYDGKGYYNLRPGLTGLWQVSDRNECDFADRVKFDDVYDRVLSFPVDIAVILRTFAVVFRGTGY